MKAAKIGNFEEYKIHVILLLDEMHIREDLFFGKNTGTLVSFVNLGDINSHLLNYERSLQQDTTPTCPRLKRQ